MKYKISKGFIIEKIDDSLVIFDSDKSVFYTLNETAAFIFQKLKRGFSEGKIVEAMVKKYDVDKERVKRDVRRIITRLEKNKIIEKVE